MAMDLWVLFQSKLASFYNRPPTPGIRDYGVISERALMNQVDVV